MSVDRAGDRPTGSGVPQLLLDVEAVELKFRVFFNEVLIEEADGSEPVRAAAKLGGWAVPGQQALRAEWEPVAHPTDRPRRLLVRIRHGTSAAQVELAKLEGLKDGRPKGGTAATFAFRPVATWTWTTADSLRMLTPGDRNDVLALLARLHAALAAGDRATLLELQTVQITEQAVANGGDPRQALASYHAFLGDRMGAGWTVEPLGPGTIVLTVMGGGRIVRATRADGGPAIRCHSPDGGFALLPYLARIGGVWHVVR